MIAFIRRLNKILIPFCKTMWRYDSERYGHAACDGKLICVRGNGNDVYDWDEEAWIPKMRGPSYTALDVRSDGVISLKNREVSFSKASGAPPRKLFELPAQYPPYRNTYVAFGAGKNRTLFVRPVDPDSPSYLVDNVELRPQVIPNLFVGLRAAASVLHDGRLMITGGSHRSALSRVAIVDFSKFGAITQAQRMLKQRTGHRQTTLGTGEVLVSGGCTRWEAEVYCPVTDTWVLVGAEPLADTSAKKDRTHYDYQWISDERGLVAIEPRRKHRVFPVELEQWWTPADHVKIQTNIRRRATYLFVCLVRAGLEAYALMVVQAAWRTKLVVKKK